MDGHSVHGLKSKCWAASLETEARMETVKIKTCCELQEYAWIDGALVRLEDLVGAKREETAARSALLKMPRILFPEDKDLSRLTYDWIAYKWMHQHSPNPANQ
jgi:hypothetical protein